jgi:hypothetical protein
MARATVQVDCATCAARGSLRSGSILRWRFGEASLGRYRIRGSGIALAERPVALDWGIKEISVSQKDPKAKPPKALDKKSLQKMVAKAALSDEDLRPITGGGHRKLFMVIRK